MRNKRRCEVSDQIKDINLKYRDNFNNFFCLKICGSCIFVFIQKYLIFYYRGHLKDIVLKFFIFKYVFYFYNVS